YCSGGRSAGRYPNIDACPAGCCRRSVIGAHSTIAPDEAGDPQVIDALEPRISSKLAALYLGCSRRHLQYLIANGALQAWAIRSLGAPRPRWSVTVSSVRSQLRERCCRLPLLAARR